jgi:hypothetical protein
LESPEKKRKRHATFSLRCAKTFALANPEARVSRRKKAMFMPAMLNLAKSL